MNFIRENIKHIKETMYHTAEHCGRNPDDIQLVAVSKTYPAEAITEAFNAGQTLFGENRIQEADKKIGELSTLPLSWHLIGHLQTNKAKRAIQLFSLLHTVDSTKLVKELEKEATKLDTNVSVLLQVNIAEEASKSGASVHELEMLIQAVNQAPHIQCQGFMTIPPYFEEPEEVRPYFQTLRSLGEQYRTTLTTPPKRMELSMGMSHDFHIAIEEGATLVRVGTAIFGERD